jgi:hypothetical protein
VPQNAPETTPHQPTPREPLWLCLAFVPKPASSGAPRTASARGAAKRDAGKPVVPSVDDDAFLRTLAAALRRGSVTEVDMPTARTLRNPGRGQHFVLKMEGGGFRTGNAQRGSRAAYQHPGCLTGRCVPPGAPCCLCPCSVCRPDQRPLVAAVTTPRAKSPPTA